MTVSDGLSSTSRAWPSRSTRDFARTNRYISCCEPSKEKRWSTKRLINDPVNLRTATDYRSVYCRYRYMLSTHWLCPATQTTWRAGKTNLVLFKGADRHWKRIGNDAPRMPYRRIGSIVLMGWLSRRPVNRPSRPGGIEVDVKDSLRIRTACAMETTISGIRNRHTSSCLHEALSRRCYVETSERRNWEDKTEWWYFCSENNIEQGQEGRSQAITRRLGELRKDDWTII